MARKAIPHVITRGANRQVMFVESWPDQSDVGEPGTGWLRTFEENEWVSAACYVQNLKAGKVPAPEKWQAAD